MRGVSSKRAKRRDSSGLALAVFGGSAGLVGLLAGCGWFLLHDDLGKRVDPAITARLKAGAPILAAKPNAAEPETGGMTLASVESKPVDLPPAKPAAKPIVANVAMLDITSSLGPSTFQKTPPGQIEERFTLPAAPRAPVKQAQGSAKQDAAPPASPPVRVAALGAPLPTPRPSVIPQSPVAEKPAARTADKPPVAKTESAKTVFEKLFGKPEAPEGALAYAPTDGGLASDVLSPAAALKLGPPYDKYTAVYDITARKVYLPDGTVLEAHSGRGAAFDNPKLAHQRMMGPTPPHLYTLKEREAIFYGVRAIRLTPVGGEKAIFGRNGLLAHTYLYGPRGESFGCVSFPTKDYHVFLRAFDRGEVKKLAVLAKVD